MPDRELRQLGDAVEVEALHEIGAVRLDRLDADVQHRGDLLGAAALGDQLQDLAFQDATPAFEVGAEHLDQQGPSRRIAHRRRLQLALDTVGIDLGPRA